MDVKQAALTAREYLTSIIGIQPDKITIEEVETSQDGNCWIITLGYYLPREAIVTPFYLETRKEYKVFKIKKSDGEVISMKIRKAQ